MKIGIIGDIFMGYYNSDVVNYNKIVDDYSKSSILNILNNNDYNIGNLEAPITSSDRMISKTGPALKNPEQVIDILNKSKIGYLALANNHIYDYGEKGLKDTLEKCRSNKIKTFGAGLTLQEIREPLFIEDADVKVAFISFAENEFNTIDLINKGFGSNSLDIIDLCDQIKVANSNSDFVILISHGGHEEYPYPSPRIKKLYRFLIDMGADALIAHHPHVVQGYEEYDGKMIFYSIGNYFFPSHEKIKPNHEGIVVNLEIKRNKLTYNILPYSQCLNDYSINYMEGEEKQKFMNTLKLLSYSIENDEELEEKWKNFLNYRNESFIYSLFPINPKIAYRLVKFGFDKLFVPKKHFLKILNLIRCESHRDILRSALKEKVQQVE